jgi:MarR family transcriptional regulator, 2-MHQ and catechol-resistance regulon repressor
MTIEQRFTQVLRDWSEVFMHRSMTDFKRFMDDSGLSASQVNTLMRLHYSGACSVSDLGAHAGITNAASSQMIDRLVGMDLLMRSEDQSDRRNKVIDLSPKGRALIEQGIEARRSWMEELTTAISPDEQQAIVHALTLLTQAARRLERENLGVTRP